MDQLSETIQVGGARYALGSRAHSGFKNRKQFQQDFDAGPDTEHMFRTYFKVDPLSEGQNMLPRFQQGTDPLSEGQHMLPRFQRGTDPLSENKSTLSLPKGQEASLLRKKLLARLRKMQHTNEFTSMDLKNKKLQHEIVQMERLIESLDQSPSASLTTSLTTSLTALNKPATMHDISENDKLEFIIKVAWFLLHIDDLPKDVQEKWKGIRKQTEEMSISYLLRQMNEVTPPQESLNYFKNMNTNQSNDEMKKSVQSLLDILHIKKYLSTHSKSETLSLPLQNAMGSVIHRFKDIFDPLYTVLKKGIPSSIENTLPSLLLTLHLCDILRSKPKGLYRITDVPSSLLDFVTSQLDAVHNYVTKSKKRQEEFHRQVYALSTQSFKNEQNSIIQLYVKDHNVRLLIDQEPISSFFMDGAHLYLLSTTYHNIQEKNTPLELHSIEYRSLHIEDAVFYETIYQTKRNETVEDVFMLNPTMAYTSTELAMSMLIAYDNLTSNQNESAD